MITEDHTDTGTNRSQEVIPIQSSGSDKHCVSPCSSTSPSPSPSAAKSSTESSVTATSSGDEGDGRIGCHRNGTVGNVTPDGFLTPPTDLENQNDAATKPLRCNGRLEFYKEGVLCLELSHCEEGQGQRKWLKTKGKSDIRQVVRVSKEVSVPCSPSPPNQMITHPPNGHSSLHDMSDEGSSGGSSSGSPKSRDKSWRKQSVPQKLISTNLEFYMHPSPCIHCVLIRKRKENRTELTPRRPYALPQPSQWIRKTFRNDACYCGQPRRRYSTNKKNKSSILKRRPIDEILLKVRADSNAILKGRTKSQSPRSTPSKIQRSCSTSSSTNTTLASRKRPLKDIEEEGMTRTKKSPIKNLEKTILSVPGVGNNPKIRHDPSTDTKISESSLPVYDHKKYSKSHAGRSSPYSLIRPKIEQSEGENVESEDCGEDQDSEDILTPEEQQQYAMTRAINYTITSLLSQGTPSSPSTSTVDKRNGSDSLPTSQYPSLKVPFGLEEDKKSFLRHLLDTSDPIPTTYASLTPSKQHNSNHAQLTDKSQKTKNNGKPSKRNNNKMGSSDSTETSRPPATTKGRHRLNAANQSSPSLYHGGGTNTPPTLTPPPFSVYGVPSPAQLESITGSPMQYTPNLIPPPTRGGKVAFTNPALTRIPPPIPPPTTVPTLDGNEVPINLSQKDGNWPDAKCNPNDRASRIHLEGRAFPILHHENLNEGSDPDLPLDLCKKRRGD